LLPARSCYLTQNLSLPASKLALSALSRADRFETSFGAPIGSSYHFDQFFIGGSFNWYPLQIAAFETEDNPERPLDYWESSDSFNPELISGAAYVGVRL